jgi:hypothetical protein
VVVVVAVGGGKDVVVVVGKEVEVREVLKVGVVVVMVLEEV